MAAMPTYIYETVPANPKTTPKRYEIEQRMSEDALTEHPKTGEPIRRIPAGGIGIISSGADDMVPCSTGGCMVPRQIADQNPCGGGVCG